MNDYTAHNERVQKELKAAGMSSYGSSKFASHYLPKVIHQDEVVMAAVYGRYKAEGGILGYSAGMLVATNKRVIFLDHKPGYTTTDELTYEVVSGIKLTTNGILSTVVLHTRIADYVIRFANVKGAEKFVRYIESRRLETNDQHVSTVAKLQPAELPGSVEPAALDFLKIHNLGVLSTIGRSGTVHGAAVYYYINEADQVCILTKASTQKARDMYTHQQIALTVYDADKEQTVQLSGLALVETDPVVRSVIFNELVKPRIYAGQKRLPPVTTIHQDSYVALRITPTLAHFNNYATAK
jgi:hypothetical protein